MKKALKLIGLLFLIFVLYLLLWPVPIDPQIWHPPVAPDMTQGPYQVNDRLKSVKKISVADFGSGPEDITVDENGYVYTGLMNGKILRFDPDGSNPEVIAETEGRPLGMQFDAHGNLIIADAEKGLLSMNQEGGFITLVREYNGEELGVVNDLDIASDGMIYFTDASSKFDVGNYYLDIAEHGLNGSVYVYDPSTGQANKLMDSLSYANGVALSPDESSLLINELSAYRIHRYWLEGPQKGSTTLFAENLPGFPDNLSCNGKDIFWVALANPRNAALDRILPSSFLRKMIIRLPDFLRPSEVKYGIVLGFDLKGDLIHNLQDPDGGFAPVTSVNEWQGNLYLGSLSADAWAILPKP